MSDKPRGEYEEEPEGVWGVNVFELEDVGVALEVEEKGIYF